MGQPKNAMDLSKYEYFRNDLGVLYCGDCLEILPHLEPVDLVLENNFTNSTNNAIISYEEKQERSLQDRSGKGIVGTTERRNGMALPRSKMVNGSDGKLFQRFTSGDQQDTETAENSIKGQGKAGERKREIQGREVGKALSNNDRERSMLRVHFDEKSLHTPQERGSLRQPSGEFTDTLHELPQQSSQKNVVGKTKIVCLTDPPYEIHAGYGGGCFGKRSHLVKTGGFTDSGCDHKFLDLFNDWFCFCSLKQLPTLLKIAEKKQRFNLITWCKPNPVPTCNNKYLPDVEYVVHGFTNGRLFGNYSDKSSYANIPCGKKETDHPNEKPLLLIRKLITVGSNENDFIIDPFMGSGTTAVACEQLNRRWIGIEISEKYCEIAKQRIERERQQLKLFEPKAEKMEQGKLF
jgi:site-specific DNA-methyltransferase (adenine-specific)